MIEKAAEEINPKRPPRVKWIERSDQAGAESLSLPK